MNGTMNNPLHSKTKFAVHQTGAIVVEMVIVLPVLLLLMLGTAELGRAFFQYNTLTKSVRDGARYLSDNALTGTTGVVNITPALQTETKNLVVYGRTSGDDGSGPLVSNLDPTDVTVIDYVPFDPSALFLGNHITVSATYNYVPMVWAPLPAFTLQATANMRALR